MARKSLNPHGFDPKRIDCIKDPLAWLPDPVVAGIILILAAAIAFSLYRIVRKLIRRLLARERSEIAVSDMPRAKPGKTKRNLARKSAAGA